MRPVAILLLLSIFCPSQGVAQSYRGTADEVSVLLTRRTLDVAIPLRDVTRLGCPHTFWVRMQTDSALARSYMWTITRSLPGTIEDIPPPSVGVRVFFIYQADPPLTLATLDSVFRRATPTMSLDGGEPATEIETFRLSAASISRKDSTIQVHVEGDSVLAAYLRPGPLDGVTLVWCDRRETLPHVHIPLLPIH